MYADVLKLCVICVVLMPRSVFRYDDVTVPQVVGDLEAMDGKSPPQSIPGKGQFTV